VHARFRAGLRVDIRTRDDPIRCDEDVPVEEILLRRSVADVRFPLNLAGRGVETTEEAIARSEIQVITRDRGRMRESSSSFKFPDDFRRLGLGVRR